MNQLKLRTLGISLLLIGLLASVYQIGYNSGRNVPKEISVSGIKNINPEQKEIDFGTFWQAWEFISENHLKGDTLQNEDRLYGSIRGLVASLEDPYSDFFSPEDNKKFQEDIQGNFSGIGAEIGIRKGQLVVITPLKGTPAEKAGLEPGDKIFEIDGEFTEGITIDEAVRKIRGPAGKMLKLLIFRDSWEKPRDIEIVRQNIEVPSVDFEMKSDLAYISLNTFNANAGEQFYKAALQAVTQNAKGLVLDLRNNPGGYLEVAVQIAGWFLPKDALVVKEDYRDDRFDEFKANGNEALVDMPVVVLINEGSASASEILAGALRDQRGIKLVGQKSFGKGTVQQVLSLRDGSTLKLTIAQWVLPKGQILEKEGLEPDVLVEKKEDTKEDEELEKALSVLRGIISEKE